MFQTILVPVDGSSYGDTAVRVAAAIKGKSSGRMIILHVMGEIPEEMLHAAEVEHVATAAEPPAPRLERLSEDIMTRYPMTNSTRASLEVLEFAARSILDHARQVAVRAGAEEVSVRTEQGDVAERILATAKSEKADLIVMGHRGLGRLERMLLGGVSTKVCQLADCCTLIAK